MYSISGILILEYENVLPEYKCMIQVYSTLFKAILSIYVGVGTYLWAHLALTSAIMEISPMLTYE